MCERLNIGCNGVIVEGIEYPVSKSAVGFGCRSCRLSITIDVTMPANRSASMRERLEAAVPPFP
ncbi:hypothetical protein B0H10DRAFT_2078187 [Mycena sp. CBHHK59/15]|nr:hypothetical protein B0H10DRAFT_2078187 [Mycena sp. CBHHK59/15]